MNIQRNFFEDAFLLEKSVYQWIWGFTTKSSTPYVAVSDPGAPGNMDKLKLNYTSRPSARKYTVDKLHLSRLLNQRA